MQVYEYSKLITNMTLSAIYRPISMLISYIYVPVVLNYLGSEKYGIWSTVLSILSWISYFDIGIGNGLRNKLTTSLILKDGQSKKLVSSAYAFLSVAMFILAFLGSLVAYNVDWNLLFGTHCIDERLEIIVIVSIIFVCLNFILSLSKNILYALQRAADVSVIELSTQVLNLIGVCLACKYIERNLFAMTIIYGCSMLIANIVSNIILFLKYSFLAPAISEVKIKTGLDIGRLGLKFFIIQICALVLFTTDSLIISYLYGATNVTPYSIVNKLFNLIIGLYVALITPIWSAVTKYKSEQRYNEIISLIWNLNRIMIIFFSGAIVLALFIRPITYIWLGTEIIFSKELIISGCLYCIMTIWCNTYSYISNGLQIMNETIMIALIQAIFNLPLSLFLAEIIGLKSAGVLGGTVISMSMAAIYLPYIIYKEIKNNISTY